MTPKDKERYIVKFVLALLIVVVVLGCGIVAVVHSQTQQQVYLPLIQGGNTESQLVPPTPAPTQNPFPHIPTPTPDTIIIGG